jgi:hypothetical protein
MRPIRTWAGVVKGYRRTSWLAAIALVCCPTGSLLAQGAAWPAVDVAPVTAASAAWLARRASPTGVGATKSAGVTSTASMG